MAPPGEPRRPRNPSRGPLKKPYQTNGFLKELLQRHCGCLSAYAVGRPRPGIGRAKARHRPGIGYAPTKSYRILWDPTESKRMLGSRCQLSSPNKGFRYESMGGKFVALEEQKTTLDDARRRCLREVCPKPQGAVRTNPTLSDRCARSDQSDQSDFPDPLIQDPQISPISRYSDLPMDRTHRTDPIDCGCEYPNLGYSQPGSTPSWGTRKFEYPNLGYPP
eukprot:gene12790-biopygen6896